MKIDARFALNDFQSLYVKFCVPTVSENSSCGGIFSIKK